MSNAIQRLAAELRPRERILSEGNARSLSSCELLAVLLKTGCEACDVLELSRRVLSAFGTIAELQDSDCLSFTRKILDWNNNNPDKIIKGIGQVKMVELLAAFELARRGVPIRRRKAVESLDALASAFVQCLGLRPSQECFMIAPLDSENALLCKPQIVSTGCRYSVMADPREVYSRALRWGAESVVVAHNHLDGSVEPSEDDVVVTKRLCAAGRIVGVRLMDHLIVSEGSDFASLRELGCIEDG